jgi:hypothetical protein
MAEQPTNVPIDQMVCRLMDLFEQGDQTSKRTHATNIMVAIDVLSLLDPADGEPVSRIISYLSSLRSFIEHIPDQAVPHTQHHDGQESSSGSEDSRWLDVSTASK